MSPQPVEPKLGAASFSCPHCGAFADQHSLRLFAIEYGRDKRPVVYKYNDGMQKDVERVTDDEMRKRLLAFERRLKKHLLTYMLTSDYGVTCNWEMANLALSMCHSCGGFAVWFADRIIYPEHASNIIPNEEMPDVIKEDFNEAASIVDKSPRGAAALLRLCMQKLMPILHEKGDNLNEDIAALVRKGLPVAIQQALDLVRVTGNNAVHPGQIDLKDDRATAMTVFTLVNLIVENLIAAPKHIDQMFNALPEEARKAIEKRDG